MIVRHHGNLTLMDLEALTIQLGRRAPATIRKHCQPIASDIATRRHLYNADQAITQMAQIPERRTTRRQPKLTNATL